MSGTDARSRAATARAELERLLEADARPLRGLLPSGFADAAERYVALLLEVNQRLNLTRIVEPADVARRHLLDAISALPIVDELTPRRALDIGSGGGVPGMVLALARPEVNWVLVDSVRKKVDVMRGFVEALAMTNVTVLAARAEALGRDPAHRDRYDLVTARACAALPVLAEFALPLLRPSGTLLAWKGAASDAELAGGQAAALTLGGGSLEVRPSGTDALGDHRFVVIPKVAATPDRFPRRPGEPSRRPLGSG